MSLPVQLAIVGTSLGTHHVRRVRFRHVLHEPWRLVLDVASTDPDLDLDRTIGASAELSMPGEALLPRIVGIVEEATQTAVEVGGESTYVLTLVPSVARLARRRSQRIFQHQDVIATFAQLLGEHDLEALDARVFEPHADREYSVQWKESDLDLALRLLAEDGLTLVTSPGLDVAHITDQTPLGTDRIGPTLPFDPDAHALREPTDPACVRNVTVGRRLEAGHVAVRDYDFTRPELIPEGRMAAAPAAASGVEGRLDVYGFAVGTFADEAGAALEATRRLEGLRADVRTLRLELNAAVPAGVRVTVVGHPRSDVDGELLVIESETTWTPTSRADVAVCIPAHVRFRPQRREKPRVHGAHTAFVVTPDGEEIDVDEHGRVMVEMRWDRRDLHTAGTSRRVRVSQPWAGAGFGMTLIPRRNEEVIVTYLDGDPDEPIIAGRVHNGWSRDPLTLPAERTQSIWKSRSVPSPDDGSAYNMVRMEDAAGAEMLELRAQRDFRSETLRNADTIVGVDESKEVGGSSRTQVAGAYSLTSASTTIGTGAYTVSASSITMSATGDTKQSSGGNHIVDTGGYWVSARGVAQMSAQKIVLMAGGSSITLTPGGITITSSGPVDIHGSPIKLNC